MSPTTQALERLVIRDDDFASALRAIYERRYTGSFTVHCIEGEPKKIEFPGIQVTLITQGRLDKDPNLADST